MQTCETCQFWCREEEGLAKSCHRSNPQVIVSSFRHLYGSENSAVTHKQECDNGSLTASTGKFMTVWPRTLKNGFCGEWKKRDDIVSQGALEKK